MTQLGRVAGFPGLANWLRPTGYQLGAFRPEQALHGQVREPSQASASRVHPVMPGNGRIFGVSAAGRGGQINVVMAGELEDCFPEAVAAYATQGSLLAEYRATCEDVPDDVVEFDASGPPA